MDAALAKCVYTLREVFTLNFLKPFGSSFSCVTKLVTLLLVTPHTWEPPARTA